MNELIKYPRTPHIRGSRLQKGDEDMKDTPFSSISSKYLVVEEKIDGANSGISFDENGEVFLQSRGHFLTGGYRERHFNLLKTWVNVFKEPLYEALGSKYIMYGEWMYAKHTVFYDNLPHYFFEFDIYDKENQLFLSTEKRKEILKSLPFVQSVPVLYEGRLKNVEELKSLLTKSLYKTDNWQSNLKDVCEKENIDFEKTLLQSDNSDKAEGLYIKIEEDGVVKERYKFVRQEFTAQILSTDDHWLDRPIVPNLLKDGELNWN